MQLPSPFVFLLLGAIGLLYWWYTTRGAGSPGAHGSVLETYTKDLTELARQKKVDPVIGRSEEIDRVIHILTRRTKNNPLLIGEPGVGKTAIVEGIACRIAAGDVPEQLKNKRVLMLDLGGLISGTKYRGEFEARMKRLTNEIQVLARIVILFIDEVHMIEQAKGTEGAMNVSDILKPALSRGELQAIGATTWTEYERYIQSDDALNRRFQPVIVGEPSAEATLDILRGVRLLYETYHHVAYTEEALQAAVSLSEKRIHNRFLPDKAIDLIDEAGAKVSIDATHHAKHALGLLHAAGAATASRTAFLSVELR
nr:ATP-dependent Clp protease ATP-binding subunit [Patescibacteria group bacterium]